MSAGTLDALLVAAAHAHGERDAVVMTPERLTYAALERDSAAFARTLVAHGVERGDRVGLWLPKSPRAIVALWGVLRAGAAYVPVDPGAPIARVEAIARDGGFAALVTHDDRLPALVSALAVDAPMRCLVLADRDAATGAVAGLPWIGWDAATTAGTGALPHVASDDLAYVLYTSGSTGEPKGVAHTHASARAFVDWAAKTFALADTDRVGNHAPFHFDLSTFDLFASAAAGASIHPVPPRMSAFPTAIAGFVADARLTVWYETPSALALMLHRGELARRDLSALRWLLFAGEVMPPALLRELMTLAPATRFANLYGPTETNVCTWQPIETPPRDDTPLPIGRACSGDQVHVLDDDGRPVATGEPGELWVSGASVMRGYWGRPEWTAAALRPIRTATGDTVAAYRTGDRVRADGSGVLEFLGRRDDQIKTRGYRVELGEIETALLAHPAVAEAVVLAPPDPDIGHRLLAVVVTRDAAVVDAAELLRHCGARLPRYMVPEHVHFRAHLPRTSSGKVDRRALAAAGTASEGPPA